MTDITTRPAEVDDLPILIEMIKGLAAHHRDLATIDVDTLRQGAFGPAPVLTILIALNGHDVVGYCALCPLVQLQFGVFGLDMHHLYVRPDARGLGVGHALIDATVLHAKARGCRYIVVGTHPDNKQAQAFYKASGFDDAPPSGPRFRMKLD